jgi:hypothetical protein
VGLSHSFTESGLSFPVLFVLSFAASVSSRTDGGTAYLTVHSGTVCIVLFVVCNHSFVVDHDCSVC